jgi:hypothetical protein
MDNYKHGDGCHGIPIDEKSVIGNRFAMVDEVKKGKRKRNPAVKRRLEARLDGSFGPDRGKRIVVTLHPDGRLELRPERSRRTETVHAIDVYRFAVSCRANRDNLERARTIKARKAQRLADERQQRAEKRLVWKGKRE